ncbi:hypothetical protein [Vibrio harveyi]
MDKADKIFVVAVDGVIALSWFTSEGFIVSFLLRLAAIFSAFVSAYNLYNFVIYVKGCITKVISEEISTFLFPLFGGIIFGLMGFVLNFAARAYIISHT